MTTNINQKHHAFEFGPISFYRGPVMHQRMRPVSHRFSYSVFSLLIDLDALDQIDRQSPFFSVNKFNLMSVYERDHGPRDGSSLATHARRLFKEAGLHLEGGRILLLCYPRILGYVFDPLSVYFAYDDRDQLVGLLYEVRNTFGEHHTYVAPLKPGEQTEAGIRQESPKRFFVSPFNPVEMAYRFRIHPPDETIGVRILVTDQEHPVMAASFHGRFLPFSTRSLLQLCLTIPFLTLKIIGGIHIEALRLWMKGLRLRARPAPPAPSSVISDK
jgi:uncharacterized protein